MVIEQLRFMKAVEKVARAKEKDGKSEWWLARLQVEDNIRDEDVNAAVLPACMTTKHWITIRIDPTVVRNFFYLKIILILYAQKC